MRPYTFFKKHDTIGLSITYTGGSTMGLWLYRAIFAILLIGATFSLKPFDLSTMRPFLEI